MFLKGLPSLGKSAQLTDKTIAMQYTKKLSYQAALWAFTLVLITLGFVDSLQASSKSKPIEILSDPFGYGVPTHYTVLRGHTKATFSHPMFGQFTRAEIVQREKNGYRTTRFALSPDGHTYQPVMIQFRNFETYGYPKEDEHCVDPSLAISPLMTVKSLGPALKDSELIAKRRDELAKARFFDASCFDPSITEEHRNAIFNAAADVLTPELQEKDSFPKYLRCLEKYGLAHESGIQQGLVKQVVSGEPIRPKLKLSCTKDTKAKTAEFREKQNEIVFRITPKPDRETYAQKTFHELQHTVPIKDGLPLDLIEECCTLGEQCQELQAAAEKRKLEERNQALLNTAIPVAQVASAAQSISVGNEIAISHSQREPTAACIAAGEAQCRKLAIQSSLTLENLSQCPAIIGAPKTSSLLAFITPAFAATPDCRLLDSDVLNLNLQDAMRQVAARDGQATLAAVAKTTPVTSPISWDVPVEPQQPVVPLGGLASTATRSSPSGSRETTGTRSGGGRTIASIAPLPEPTAAKSLGSASGRRDVAQTNRATVLVDTLERAANSVKKQLTFEKLDARKVDSTEVFRATSTEKDKPMFVVASLAEKPFQISNVADVKGLTFPNPFAKGKASDGSSTSLSKVETTEQGKPADTKTGTNGIETSTPRGTVGSRHNQASAPSGPHAQIEPGGKPVTERGIRSPSKSNSPNFETMSYSDLRKFLVGSYRQVAAVLEDQEFAKSLSKNGIQIYDHENRQIGATKATMVEGQLRHTVFIYSAEKSRLIQSRATTRDQTR